ncbi:MAG: divalent-cation tolerance protein CutA [Croceibacterium sp.]
MSAALIWCPFESEDAAAKAVSQLLDEGLIACANLIPGIRSLYLWQGERGEARECGALFKTEAGLLDKAVARLAAIHPYDTPAIAGWRADATPPVTAAWLGEMV